MIPVNITALSPRAKQRLQECIDTTWISSEGKFVHDFEAEFAKYLGVKHAIAVNSGTSALELACLGLGLKAGDEVILPASTIASCYFAIWHWGGKAVPVDVELDTYNLDPTLIEKAITKKTKAIMVVHLFGRPASMTKILAIAQKHKLAVIEDAAEAHGAMIDDKKVSSLGTVGCFSFYANKLVTTGEGGMVVTNSDKIAQLVRDWKNLGRTKKSRFIHDKIGFNFHMSNLEAAVGLSQLETLESAIKHKYEMAELYHEGLKNIPGLILPAEFPEGRQVYWMYAIRVIPRQFGCNRDELAKRLWEDYQIQTRTFFNAPRVAFKPLKLLQKQKFPVAEKIGREGLYLPSGTAQTATDFKKVIRAIKKISAELHA